MPIFALEWIKPFLGLIIPLINFKRVLFPLPFLPTTIQNPGFFIEKLHLKIEFYFFPGYEKETSLNLI